VLVKVRTGNALKNYTEYLIFCRSKFESLFLQAEFLQASEDVQRNFLEKMYILLYNKLRVQ